MSSEATKNDVAWEALFHRYHILECLERNGFFEITAGRINELREARLMTKFDHKINLPRIFRDHELSILPITRGSYLISHFAAYQDFAEEKGHIVRAAFPEYLESIDYENITSEAMAINCAYLSGILADFLEDDELLPTVNGRMSSNIFSFKIWNFACKEFITVGVKNAQLEIDGGYEGVRNLSLIEAKNFISDDFLIRQLYYPYRLWSNSVKKAVKPIFLVYSNGIFNLYEYKFQDPNVYNSLVLVKRKNYSIEPVDIALDDIITVAKRVRYVQEPKVPFPQADSFARVINLCELLSANEMTREDITLNYAFDPRQTNYYTDAGRYLGFIDKRRENGEVVFFLTKEGHSLLHSRLKTRQLRFVEAILRHSVFNEALQLYLQHGEMPSREAIVALMKQAHLYQVEAESTYRRRASTIAGWLNWILDLQR